MTTSRSPPSDQFRNLQIFARRAEVGSFAAAARALGVTRGPVAQAVFRLEADLSVRLLSRTNRPCC